MIISTTSIRVRVARFKLANASAKDLTRNRAGTGSFQVAASGLDDRRLSFAYCGPRWRPRVSADAAVREAHWPDSDVAAAPLRVTVA